MEKLSLFRFKKFPSTAWVGLLCLSLAFDCFGAFGFKLDGTLDKEAISHAYFEGEFSRVLPPLEMYRQSIPANATREDSIFVYKYLSVIYAADSTTRPKAESFMVQLIKLMPTIELIDLYISDNIQAIFKNVKSEYLKQQEYVRDHDEYGHPKNSPEKTALKSDRKNNSVWWFAGSVGAAAAIGTVVYFYNPDEEPRKTVVPIWQGGHE